MGERAHDLQGSQAARDWLTTHRIGLSDLTRHVLFEDGEGRPRADIAHAVLLAALRCFALGRCFRLASVASEMTGRPIATLWRRGPVEGTLVHAALFDPSTHLASDVLGRSTIAAIRGDLLVVAGPLVLRVTPKLEDDDYEDGEKELLQVIAAGLPWMTGAPTVSMEVWRRAVLDYDALFGGQATADFGSDDHSSSSI